MTQRLDSEQIDEGAREFSPLGTQVDHQNVMARFDELQLRDSAARAQEVSSLIETLKRENARIIPRFVISLIVLMGLTGALLARVHVPDFTGLTYVPGFVMAARFASSRRLRRAVNKLSGIDDLRAIGPLLDTLALQDRRTERSVRPALIRMLPRLRQSDSELLTERQKLALYKSLTNNKAELGRIRLENSRGFVLGAVWSSPARDYVLAALDAVEQIGDGRALPFVLKLADGRSAARRRPDIQQRAGDVVPVLQDRLSAEQQRDRLLRPATLDADQPDSLLRPAEFTPADETLLLRAAPQNEVN